MRRYDPRARWPTSILIRLPSSSSAGICLVEVGDDDLLHLHHGLHGAIGLFAIGIAHVTAEGRGHNLPGQAEFVLEPSAFRFLAALGDQSVPEVVHLFLALDADEEGDRLVELVFWAAIEGVELLPLELEARHEVIDGFDLGIGKHRFVEGDSLGDIVVEPEERRDRSHGDVLVGWDGLRCPALRRKPCWPAIRRLLSLIYKTFGFGRCRQSKSKYFE